jgi:hypothetical protein
MFSGGPGSVPPPKALAEPREAGATASVPILVQSQSSRRSSGCPNSCSGPPDVCGWGALSRNLAQRYFEQVSLTIFKDVTVI